MNQKHDNENGIDDHDHYGDPDVPRSDDLYKRCVHDLIMDECGTCLAEDVNYCACGNESRYNPVCDECSAKYIQTLEN